MSISDLIGDEVLRKIAKAHHLDDWEWNADDDPYVAATLMKGAAIAIEAIYEEGRKVEVIVHETGTMVILAGAYFSAQVNPSDEVVVERANDWDDDPVVKQYRTTEQLTLCFDEAAEMFGECEPASGEALK